MSIISLDLSANTHKNDKSYIKRMIDEVKRIDTGVHEVVFKHQLFTRAGENIPLMPDIFEFAYDYANSLGYKSTSSVFDVESLKFLLDFDVPFIKIANNRKLDFLIDEIPRRIQVVRSIGSIKEYFESMYRFNEIQLLCVSKYPCKIEDYEREYGQILKFTTRSGGISDHTTDFELYNKYLPSMLETHYKLEDSTGLDAGPFARTPSQLAEIL